MTGSDKVVAAAERERVVRAGEVEDARQKVTELEAQRAALTAKDKVSSSDLVSGENLGRSLSKWRAHLSDREVALAEANTAVAVAQREAEGRHLLGLLEALGNEGQDFAGILTNVALDIDQRLQRMGKLLDQAQTLTAVDTKSAARVAQLRQEHGLGPPPSRPERLPWEKGPDPAGSTVAFVTFVSGFNWPALLEIATRFRGKK